jgi:hypothetical protein
MTPEEARKALDENGLAGWVGWQMWNGGAICLDGDFTIKELEALLVLMRQPRSNDD